MRGDIFRDPWITGYQLPGGQYTGNLFVSFGEFYGERPPPFWENPAVCFPSVGPREVSNRNRRRLIGNDRQRDDHTRIPVRYTARENPRTRHEATKLKGDQRQTSSSQPKLTQAESNIPIRIQPRKEKVVNGGFDQKTPKGEDPCDGTNRISDNQRASGETTKRSSKERSFPVDRMTSVAESAKESSPVVDNDDSQPETQTVKEQKLVAIETELARARELIPRIMAFEGTREEKEFLYLEEHLTRRLLGLDLIETDGQENVKSTRRAAVKEILSIVNDLEDRVRH